MCNARNLDTPLVPRRVPQRVARRVEIGARSRASGRSETHVYEKRVEYIVVIGRIRRLWEKPRKHLRGFNESRKAIANVRNFYSGSM